MSERSVSEPQKLSFEEPVTALNVRIVNGTVNVVGTDDAVLNEQGAPGWRSPGSTGRR